MSTPHQGPGMWQQGDERAALAWLANLDQNQQQALRRAMQTHQALGPIYNAVARVNQVTRQTATRLSEYAQQLATGARQFGQNTAARATEFGQNTAARAGQVRQAVTEFGQNTAARAGELRDAATARATEFGQNTAARVGEARQAVTEFGQNTAARATELGQNTAARATELGQQAADLGRRGVESATSAGRQAAQSAVGAGQRVAESGRQAAGGVSRWFQEKVTNASTRAKAAGAAYAAARHDPRLSGVDQKTVLDLSQKAQALVSAQTPEAQREAAQQLVQAAQGVQTNNQEANAGQEQPGSGKHRAAENPAWVLQGSPSATGAVATKPTGQQDEAANTNQNRHQKPEQER